jgi:hypothetical protein
MGEGGRPGLRERLAGVVRRGRNSVATALATAEAREAVEREMCPHNEEDGVSAARMGHVNAFICRRCGHREDC